MELIIANPIIDRFPEEKPNSYKRLHEFEMSYWALENQL
jgi:hypothetical protein